jgi:hypothetical protein
MAKNIDYSKVSDSAPVSRPEIRGSNLGRVLARQNSTGFTRGSLMVGQGGINIDGANNTISITSSIGISGIGNIPDVSNENGFFQTDSSDSLIYKLVNGTTYLYNQSDDYVNSTLIGFAPDDGRPGIWVAKPGFDVTELLS